MIIYRLKLFSISCCAAEGLRSAENANQCIFHDSESGGVNRVSGKGGQHLLDDF